MEIEKLLKTKEFATLVNKIAGAFNVSSKDEIMPDVIQACSISVVESLRAYDPEKVGGNFWGYAYLRMREYAKREIYSQRNIVHIPMNKTSEWSGFYAKRGITHDVVNLTYEGITFDDGHDKFGVTGDNHDFAIDLENILSKFDDRTRYIFEVLAELKSSKSGKCSVTALSKELGIPARNVTRLYDEAKKTLAAYFRQ